MNFAAILFDFDGVLVDTEMAIYQAWRRTFLAHGHELPLELYTRCIGSDFDTWSPKTHLEELTGRAITISTANLRTIETFAVTGLIYIALTLVASALLALAGRTLFRVRA